MAITIPKSSNREFQSAPSGSHLAICIKVVLLGTLVDEKYGNSKLKIYLQWELPEEPMDDGKPFVIGHTYTASMSENGNFRPMLEAWRGKKYTEEELDDFDASALLGKPCLLQVTEGKEGRTYVGGVMTLPKGMTAPKPSNEFLAFSVNTWDQAAFEKLGKYHQEKIMNSKEYQKLNQPDDNSRSESWEDEAVGF